MPHLTSFEETKIIELHATGLNDYALSKKIKRNHHTVALWIARYHDEKSLDRHVGSGRKRKTNAQEEIHLAVSVKRSRNSTAKAIASNILREDLSDETIRSRIREVTGFESYWTDKKPLLSGMNLKRRLEWCKQHQSWSVEDWKRVMWSDESPFELRFKQKERVWRLHNERYKPWALTPTTKSSIKINVWGCFSASGVGSLHMVQINMDQFQYQEILNEELPPSVEKVFGAKEWIFQQDNDPKHTAKWTKVYLRSLGVPVLDWPSQSPDLNPIENLWSILDKRCKVRRPKNAIELLEILRTAWNEIGVRTLIKLIESMPHRIAAVIANHGGPSKY